MGLRADGSVATTFRPNDTLSRAEFGALLSRMLWGNTYNSPNADDPNWYVAHLEALKDADIITQIDDPNEVELRAYAWIIFQRIYGIYDELVSEIEDLMDSSEEDSDIEILQDILSEFSE